MRKILVMLLIALLISATACGKENTVSSQAILPPPVSEIEPYQDASPPILEVELSPDTPPVPEQKESEQGSTPQIATPVYLEENMVDIGATLFPEQNWLSGRSYLSGQIIGNKLMVWSDEGSALYNYRTANIVYTSPLIIKPLGTEHFYSQKQEGENSFTITLYDKEMNVLAQHESERPAFPAIDGKTLIYEQRQIEVLNTETGMTFTFKPQDVNPDYAGRIWNYSFNGEWMFFATTCNPRPGGDGLGAYNALTGKAVFYEDFPRDSARESPELYFPGSPELYGKNKAFFWQDGSAYGTDGTYCVMLDAATGELQTVNVGETAARISNNGEYIAAVSSEWVTESSLSRLTEINVFRFRLGSLEVI